MEVDRFEQFVRWLHGGRTRRGLMRFGASLPLAGVLGVRLGDGDVTAKKKRKKKKCGKVGRKPVKGKCCKGSRPVDGKCARPPCDVCASGCPHTTVQAAVDAAKNGDTLTLCAGTYLGNVVIAKNLTISGTGDGEGAGDSILQGDGNGRVVRINDGITAELRDLRVTGGGGGGNSGGVYNVGTATLTRCTVTGNTGDNGGGILTEVNEGGSLTLVESHVTDNSAAIFGGGIYLQGKATLIDSTVSGNTAVGGGGGIDNTGMMELIRSTVSGNSVTAPENVAADGGGIFNSERNFPVSNLLKLTESTISGNSSTFNGGGISNLAGTIIFDGASRVTGNTAGESGGGIYNTGGGNVTLDSSANVSGNTPNNCAGDMIPLCSS